MTGGQGRLPEAPRGPQGGGVSRHGRPPWPGAVASESLAAEALQLLLPYCFATKMIQNFGLFFHRRPPPPSTQTPPDLETLTFVGGSAHGDGAPKFCLINCLLALSTKSPSEGRRLQIGGLQQ